LATRVSIARDKDFKKKTIHAINLLGGIDNFVKKSDRVTIKPNLVESRPPETGETVHLEVVRTIIQLAYDAGASKVAVGEGPTWLAWPNIDLTLHQAYEKMTREENAEMVNFNLQPFDQVEVESPLYFKSVRLAHALFDCDVFINVPTLKVHHKTGLTVALKNLYGGLPREDKVAYHRMDRLDEAIVDINIARPSDLIIVDGTYSTHHFPPFEKHELDLAIAGSDAVAVDTVAAKVMGIEPKTIRYLSWAADRGLGVGDLNHVNIVGLSIEEAYRKNTVTSVDLVNRRYKRIKIVNGGACSGCFGRISSAIFTECDESDVKEDLCILIGPNATQPVGKQDVILCGTCAAPTFFNKLKGTVVPGCPPDLHEFKRVLKDHGVKEVKKGLQELLEY